MSSRFGKTAAKRAVDSEKKAWLFSLLATTLIALVLWFGFRVRPPRQAEEVAEHTSTCHFVGNWGPTRDLEPWEEVLHTWAKLADPTLMVLPDEQLGFSIVRQEKRVLPETPFPEYHFVVALAKEAELASIRLAAPRKDLPDEMRLRWPTASPEVLEVPKVVPLPKQLAWHQPDGTLLADMPNLDLSEIQQAIADGGRPRYPTRVEIQAGAPGIPTRVRVRRASGNTALDMHVVAALRQAIGRYELRAKFLDSATPPRYLPAPGASAFLEIEWSLIPSELSPED
jgi:hypothetical protein